MDPNECSPSGFGRGRPTDTSELRRPMSYSTYTGPEFVPTEGSNTNGMFPETSWHNTSRDMSYLASPSGDHVRSSQNHSASTNSPVDKDGKVSTLSPYAKEFVPRNFRPEPRIIAAEIPDEPTIEPLPDSFPVQELRSFLSEITMNPGKFERKIGPLTDTLNSMVDDDDTMRAIVNIIFDESARQPNLRYSGARLCKSLCNDLDASPDRLNFRSVLLTRCNQEFKRREILAQAEDGGTYLRGFAMFMAELFSQLEVMKQKVTVLGDSLPNLIKTIISFDSPDNLKCACQILKLVGAYLEDYERAKQVNNGSAPEMDNIIYLLKNLATNQEITKNIRDIMGSVIKLRESDWGRSANTENTSGYDTTTIPANDEPVMYGPDGKQMTADELMFLHSQYASSNITPDADDFDIFNDDGVDELSDEISEAYEVFLRDQQQALRH